MKDAPSAGSGHSLFLNLAVLTKELRTRMRGRRAPIIITLYLLALVIAGGVFLNENEVRSVSDMFRTGSAVFTLLAMVQMALVVFIVPGLTGAAIAGERDRQTLDILLSSQVSSLGIILGKLLSSISYVLLLLLASLPVFSLSLLFGGVSPRQIAVVFLIYLATAITLGSIGVLLSTWLRRGQIATVVTYGVMFILVLGTLGLSALIESNTSSFGGMPLAPRTTNTGILALVTGGLFDGWRGPHIPLVFNPFVGLTSVLPVLGVPFVRGGGSWTGLTLWQANLIADVVIVLVCTWLSARALRPNRRSLMPWRRSSHKMVAEAEA